MRVRTAAALGLGVATGASLMYLLDPESGPVRRRELRRDALRQVREGSVVLARESVDLTQQLATAAVEGYREGRAGA